MAPPAFESNRENNEFTSLLLLHHFLGEEDLEWLKRFKYFGLNDTQKQALLFVREVGAIDNQTYRQMANCDTLKASNELRTLKGYSLLHSKGKGKSTYYVPGVNLNATAVEILAQVIGLNTPPSGLNTPPSGLSTSPPDLSAPAPDLSAPAPDLSAPPPDLSAPPRDLSAPPRDLSAPPPEILERIKWLKEREHDPVKVEGIISDLCLIRPMKANEIAQYLSKGEGYVKRKYLSGMIQAKKLKYLYPEMTNHPEQAYHKQEELAWLNTSRSKNHSLKSFASWVGGSLTRALAYPNSRRKVCARTLSRYCCRKNSKKP